MRTERYVPRYYTDLKAWCWMRGIEPPPEASLSEIGIVAVGSDGEPIAMEFMYTTNGPFAMLEGLYANPKATPEVRTKAILAVVDRLARLARDSGFKTLIGLIGEPANGRVLKNGLRLAFKDRGEFTLMVKEL